MAEAATAGKGAAGAAGAGAGGEGEGGSKGGEDGASGGEGGKGAGGEGGSGEGSLLGGAKSGGGQSLAGGAGKGEGGEVKDGDLLSMKKSDGTDKTAAEFMKDKTEADKAAAEKKGGEGGEGGKGKDAGAPEKYTDFTLPDGMDALGDEDLKGFHSLAKEFNLSQEKAQKLVDFQANIAKGQGDAAYAEFRKTTDEWAEETKKNFGADYSEKLGVAAKAIERFGPKGLRDMFDDTMVGNHPLLNQFLLNIGKAISEDKLVEGAGATKEIPDSKKFYPTMKTKNPTG